MDGATYSMRKNSDNSKSYYTMWKGRLKLIHYTRDDAYRVGRRKRRHSRSACRPVNLLTCNMPFHSTCNINGRSEHATATAC